MSTRHHTKKVSKSEMESRIHIRLIENYFSNTTSIMNAFNVVKAFPGTSNYILKRLNLL